MVLIWGAFEHDSIWRIFGKSFCSQTHAPYLRQSLLVIVINYNHTPNTDHGHVVFDLMLEFYNDVFWTSSISESVCTPNRVSSIGFFATVVYVVCLRFGTTHTCLVFLSESNLGGRWTCIVPVMVVTSGKNWDSKRWAHRTPLYEPTYYLVGCSIWF